MGKTKRTSWVCGEIVTIHKCNNCKEYIDGLPYVHWETKNFTLCVHCLQELAKQTGG